jgi:hypothetical protein
MKFILSHPVDLASRAATLFDLHEDYGLAYLVERDGQQRLFVNDELWGAWDKQFGELSMLLKWLDRSRAILRLANGRTAIISAETQVQFDFGPAIRLYVSPNHIFVGYREEDVFGFASDDDPESYAVCAYAHDGQFEFGLRSYFQARHRLQECPIEVNAAYTCGDRLYFHADVDHCIRIFDVATEQLKSVPLPSALVTVPAFWGDDRRAYLIEEPRADVSKSRFRLISIDLIAETAAEQDFSALAREISAFGFDKDKFTFRQNSHGRIIVTDGRQAALLEISTAE